MMMVSDHVCYKKDLDLRGGDITKIPLTTVAECKTECEKLTDCVAFTTSTHGKYHGCYLKNRHHNVETSCKICISGRMSCFRK